MAHFAELDQDDVVLRVLVVENSVITDESGNESELTGISFLQSLFGGVWMQTSYNGSFRGSFAAIGGIYDRSLDIFVPPHGASDLLPENM